MAQAAGSPEQIDCAPLFVPHVGRKPTKNLTHSSIECCYVSVK